ncbi:DUF3284 domain-containing protein [Listeria costaricensis]|uniref:DUF3284 domain-containing protein n=1 Tax=Listeria costaricensis TaxID=2026604 RepID=UPI0013C4C1F5|nr:DUF3284 domain-containing protein [Listeria costaricensis]
MRTDTLRYKYQMKAAREAVYQILLKEQLAYFQKADPSIVELEQGTKITCYLSTKMRGVVESTMEIKEIIPEKRIQFKTAYLSGEILQTYEFLTNKAGVCQLVYSEQNTFNKTRSQYGFMVMGLLYKFFYNRGIAKRMKYLDELALQQ